MRKPILTTITPVWNRPEMFRVWVEALKGAAHPQVQHFVYFVGEQPPCQAPPNFRFISCSEKPGLSIAHYHNLGAREAETQWMMKLDVDALPNVRLFKDLVNILAMTKNPKRWYNVGMFYANKSITHSLLTKERMPLSELVYNDFLNNLKAFTNSAYIKPAASNFVCNRQWYLNIGGCHGGFRGYGWEDYYQMYLMERDRLGRDPLPGPVTLDTAPRRVRDEIARPEALRLWTMNRWCALIHRWHPGSAGTDYKAKSVMDSNRKILLDLIQKSKG